MGKIDFEVTHSLPKEEARQRVSLLLEKWSSKGVSSSWDGDKAKLNGKVMGLTLDADLLVSESRVGGQATDPGMLLRNKAKKYLTERFERYLDPSVSLDELAREA